MKKICQILCRCDIRSLTNSEKMDVLEKTLLNGNHINESRVDLKEYMRAVLQLPLQSLGVVYMELDGMRGNPYADIFVDIIDNYTLLPQNERDMRDQEAVIRYVYADRCLRENIFISDENNYLYFFF